MADEAVVHGPLPLSSAPAMSADELAECYPWPESGSWVRAMMVTTLDGAAAGPDALSNSVSSPVDQAVFQTTRRRADAVLIGAGTLRAERYTPMRAKPADRAAREAGGQTPAPVLVVASGSLDLPWHLPVWTESDQRPLVITAAGADPERLGEAEQHAQVVVVDQLTPRLIIDALTERQLTRITCEGGPRLLRDLVAADVVDEADITVSPVFAGTGNSPHTPALPQVSTFRLVHVLHGESTLMMRYLAQGREG